MVVYVTNLYPAFCLTFHLTGVLFWGELQHVGEVSEQMFKHGPIKTLEIKEKHCDIFDAAMGAYDGAEVCEIVSLFLSNNLANQFDKLSVGLYRETNLPNSEIFMVIVQVKYVKNSNIYVRKTNYF